MTKKDFPEYFVKLLPVMSNAKLGDLVLFFNRVGVVDKIESKVRIVFSGNSMAYLPLRCHVMRPHLLSKKIERNIYAFLDTEWTYINWLYCDPLDSIKHNTDFEDRWAYRAFSVLGEMCPLNTYEEFHEITHFVITKDKILHTYEKSFEVSPDFTGGLK